MNHDPSRERVVIAHTAGTAAEAMVIRRLLESAGICSPGSGSSAPFPLREAPKGTHGAEIYVLESQVAESRRIIDEFRKTNDVANESNQSLNGQHKKV